MLLENTRRAEMGGTACPERAATNRGYSKLYGNHRLTSPREILGQSYVRWLPKAAAPSGPLPHWVRRAPVLWFPRRDSGGLLGKTKHSTERVPQGEAACRLGPSGSREPWMQRVLAPVPISQTLGTSCPHTELRSLLCPGLSTVSWLV